MVDSICEYHHPISCVPRQPTISSCLSVMPSLGNTSYCTCGVPFDSGVCSTHTPQPSEFWGRYDMLSSHCSALRVFREPSVSSRVPTQIETQLWQERATLCCSNSAAHGWPLDVRLETPEKLIKSLTQEGNFIHMAWSPEISMCALEHWCLTEQCFRLAGNGL